MAITITEQPDSNTFWSSEYPCILKATSNNSSIKYLKFRLKDGNAGTYLDIPAYYAPEIDSEFTFNVSDYMNNFLYIIRDDLVSFDATPTIHYYDNICRFVSVEITEIETDGTVDADTSTNGFYMAKAKHQVYNDDGTAQEYFDNRYYLTSLPYYRKDITPSLNAAYFYLQDGRQTPQYVTDYSRVTFFNFALGVTGGLTVTAYEGYGSEYATCAIDPTLAGGLFDQGKVCSVPVSISDLHDLSIASGESGWVLFGTSTPVSVANVIDAYLYIGVAISNTTDSAFATTIFGNPAKYRLGCPTTFIYMNRFGVHEVLTVNTRHNESVVSSRENATIVNTEWDGAYTNDLGAYLLTGARQRSINPRSEKEFTVNNRLPFPVEQAKEVILDFFASPVHYVVDVDPRFGTSFDVTHPDTITEKVRRITINDGTIETVKNDKAQYLTFTYRYADVI